MAEKIDLISNIEQNFRNYENRLNGEKSEKIFLTRKNAFEAFRAYGIPTIKHEEWKYTSLSFLKKNDFKVITSADDSSVTDEDVEKLKIPGLEENLIVFINGFYSEKYSKIVDKDDKIIIGSLAKALEENSSELNEYFGKFDDYSRNPFAAMNTALAFDGVYVKVPDGKTLTVPVHVMHIADSRENAVLSQVRNLVLGGKNSEFITIETNHTLGDKPSFMNIVTEIFLEEGSIYDLYKYQNDTDNSYYLSDTRIKQEKNSQFIGDSITLGGAFVRNMKEAILNGEGSDARFNGFFFAEGKHQVDNHILVDHAVPNCTSDQLYKGILQDYAKGNFNGKILVREDAQNTNAYQTNRNILLSDNARINTKPQLEIYADDVKCSHGATTGYLDESSMFYLMARGIPEDKARALLLNAFAGEVINRMKIDSLRESIAESVKKRLHV